MILKNGTYDKHTVIYDTDGPISVFTNVKIKNNPHSNDFIPLCGTFVPITCTPHYFHFLKEYYGFYIYFKNKYNADAKYLKIEDGSYFYPAYQNMARVCGYCYDQISDGATFNNFFNINLEIEKLIILFDSQKCITGPLYSQPDYLKTPGINTVLRNTVLSKIKKTTHSKKLYLSRKIVSKHLPNFPVDSSNESLQRWKNQQMLLRYVDPTLEDKIEQKYYNEGYEIVQLSGVDILEQASMFYHAEKIAGPIGTAFYNGIFSSDQTIFDALMLNPNYFYAFDVDIKTVLPNALFRYKYDY